jgi:uncharacterized protein YkwD
MLRTSFRMPVVLLALGLAGCGSSTDSVPTADTAPAAKKSGGAMKVAAVDGRVGDATAATSSGGVTSLKVRRRPTDPDVVRAGVGAGAACADVDAMPSADNLAVIAAATMCLVNGERADAGLPALTGNGKLDQSSIGHSQDMVAKSYFAHESQDGRDVIDRVRVTGYIPDDGEWTVGENLAWGTGTLATPKGIVQAWMNSQGHRENILRSGFREAGLGIVVGNPRSADGQGATYTMNFGSTAGNSARTVASSLSVGDQAPRISASTRRAAARRAAARRRKACRARAAKARVSRARKARLRRCARAARRSSRR